MEVAGSPDAYHTGRPYLNRMGEQEENPAEKPKILLIGMRKSGKSSIQKVVFHKMSPSETLFLESTNKIVKNDISNSSFIQFQVWDFPGQLEAYDPNFNPEFIFGKCGALIFVIDATDTTVEALKKLHLTMKKAYTINPDITFEIFIHKVDSLTDDAKMECHRNVREQCLEDIEESKLQGVHPSFYLTSIYDHSIFEAFSKVVQKLIPQLPNLENLLNILYSRNRLEKAFLIDVVSKIYVATDSSPVDMQTYELCTDMIDVVVDVSCIYGMKDDSERLAYDQESKAIIKLNNGLVLYLREVNKFLALVCLMRKDNFDKHGLLDYNFQCFKQAIVDIFAGSSSSSSNDGY